jgi:8-oxo-dGTP pyrophosphatase MutT (NUDIX family)
MTDQSPAQALFAKLSAIEPPEARLAASVLILRDAPAGLEVLMVVRNKQIEFAAGAMVFPGGKMMETDRQAGMGDRLSGTESLDDTETGLRIAAIREAFEEVGLLPAAFCQNEPASDSHVTPIAHLRSAIDRGEADFATALRQADLMVDETKLVRFAHIIAPVITPKRFNTHFYAVEAPAGQTPTPDGKEITDILWIQASDAIAMAERGERQVMFPTRMVLRRLAQFATVEAALAGARREPPQPLAPALELRGDVVGLVTPDIPGFPATWEDLDTITRSRKTLRISTPND